MPPSPPDTDQLVQLAAKGDAAAAERLLARHRTRLHRMVSSRLDRSLSARIDPSDVVREAFAEAFQKLPEYLRTRPLSFYPWLRTIAWQRLVKLRRTHIGASRRSVRREQMPALPLAESSALMLADQFLAKGTDPGRRMIREELHTRVQSALKRMKTEDRELLSTRYLEQMSLKEISESLAISTAAAKMRQARALERLERLLSDQSK
jgi:RNA polymerase sigma-70 factor (ECF subfamily)